MRRVPRRPARPSPAPDVPRPRIPRLRRAALAAVGPCPSPSGPIGRMSNLHDFHKKLAVDSTHPSGTRIAPVPHVFPVPYCRCGVLTDVKQISNRKTVGIAFYMCQSKYRVPMLLHTCTCYFFGGLMGRTSLFQGSVTELKPYNEFRRWVPPPPNSPLMTKEEKQEAAIIRVNNPPLCHCGVRIKLQRQNIGMPAKFTLFFR